MANVDIVINATDNASKKIQQATGKIEKSVEGVEKAGARTKLSFDGFKTALLGVTAVAGTVGVALKKVYDLSKQGAQIELASIKFDRLATSIGTTSAALKNDLSKATAGLMSDAEQMQLAGDLMSLGLAKTHDQAVRLTTVASQLGMDMNQLTLTLANETTMRFDAIGVSVEGFKEVLEDTTAAGGTFTDAFLVQAEKQIETVGSILDTNAGKIQKYEAFWKDYFDTLKVGMSEAVVPMLDVELRTRELVEAGLITRRQAINMQSGYLGVQRDTILARLDELEAILQTREELEEYTTDLEKLSQMGRTGIDPGIKEITTDTEEAADAAKDAEDAFNKMFDAANKDWAGALDGIGEMMSFKGAGGQQLIDFETLLMGAGEAVSGESQAFNEQWAPVVESAETQGQIAAVMFSQQLGEIDTSSAIEKFQELGMAYPEAVEAAKAGGEGWEEVLAGATTEIQKIIDLINSLNGMSATASVNVTGLPGWGGWTPQATGGPLAPLAMVGEQGPEMIINGVVIPAHVTKKLMSLGLFPSKGFATGGPLLDGLYTPDQVSSMSTSRPPGRGGTAPTGGAWMVSSSSRPSRPSSADGVGPSTPAPIKDAYVIAQSITAPLTQAFQTQVQDMISSSNQRLDQVIGILKKQPTTDDMTIAFKTATMEASGQ